jgi:glycosyltransferase involved in cell wall biosynthesis
MKILSPMAYGSGAYHVHKMLAENIADYQVCGYNPLLTLFPPLLYTICKDASADIIHCNPDYGFFFHNTQKPLVLTFHGFVLDKETRQYSTPLQRLHHSTDLLYFTRKSLEVAHTVTCVSKFTAAMVKRELGYAKPIKVIYNGVDTELFRPFSGHRKDRPLRVLFSGHPTKRKGVDLLPLIASQLNKNIIIQFTSGIRNKNRNLQADNLQELGPVPYKDMPGIYQQADILLFPTVREGFSLAILEAMASGLPVVATDCSSLPEQIINGKGGYLCEMGNADEFATRINELADSPQLRKEMGQFNREKVEQEFTLREMVENYRLLFTEISNSK